MDLSTTKAPYEIIIDEGEDFSSEEIETFRTSPKIIHENLAAHTIYFLLAVISSLCVLITVIRTKSVRGQLLGVMLVNLAVAVLIRAMVITREMETESRGGMPNFGTVGCHLYYIGLGMSICLSNAAIVIICLDATFDLPQSRKTQVISTVCVWVLAIAFTAIIFYGLWNGPEVFYNVDHDVCALTLAAPRWAAELVNQLTFHYIPTTFVLVTLIKFCCTHRKTKATEGKKLPFVLTAVTYLVLMWAVQIFYNIITNGVSFRWWSMYIWFVTIMECGKAVISLIWLFLMADLRNKCLCRESPGGEATHLLK